MDSQDLAIIPIHVGDIICFIENYANVFKNESYGLVIGEKILQPENEKRRMIQVQWFDGSRTSWHYDPALDPPYRIKNFFVVSKAKRNGEQSDN